MTLPRAVLLVSALLLGWIVLPHDMHLKVYVGLCCGLFFYAEVDLRREQR